MGRKRNDASGPFNFRGCDLTAECLPATEEVRVQFPAAAPIFLWNPNSILTSSVFRKSNSLSRAPACAAESPKLSLPGAAPGRLANFFLGSWQIPRLRDTCPATDFQLAPDPEAAMQAAEAIMSDYSIIQFNLEGRALRARD